MPIVVRVQVAALDLVHPAVQLNLVRGQPCRDGGMGPQVRELHEHVLLGDLTQVLLAKRLFVRVFDDLDRGARKLEPVADVRSFRETRRV